MKRKILFLFILLSFTIYNVNAEHIKYGDNNYLIQNEFKCGSTKVIPQIYIEKTGKLIVCEEGYDYNTVEKCYVWKNDNTCETITTQDKLDEFNNKYIINHFESDGIGSGTWTNSHQETQGIYTTGLIKPTGSFDPNGDYYTSGMFDGVKHVDEPKEENFDNYYLKVVLKHPDKAEIDPNQTYYTAPGHFNPVSDVINPEDLNVDDMTSYYVITSYEDIGFKEIKTTVGNMYYDMLRGSCRVVEEIDIDGELVFQCFGKDDNLYYYDKNGQEIERFKNYLVTKNDYYYIYQSLDNKHLIVYDVNEENIIFEKTVKGTDMIAVYEVYDTAIVLQGYTDSELVGTYINIFKPLEGNKQTYNNKDLTIRFNGNYETYKELKINGVLVPNDKYTVTKGSTIITIKKDYLDTLDSGNYNIEAIYTDGGTALATFNINEKVSPIVNPITYDNTNIYILIGIISIIGITTILLSKKTIKNK